jgi:hypothetical protein
MCAAVPLHVAGYFLSAVPKLRMILEEDSDQENTELSDIRKIKDRIQQAKNNMHPTHNRAYIYSLNTDMSILCKI